MDDSHQITASVEGINLTLSTTITFNCLNNIQTNEDKAVLLTTVVPDKNDQIVFTLQDNTNIAIHSLKLKQTT